MKGRPRIENRIRKGREEQGYFQSDLSFLLGHATTSQVSRYERGLVRPDFENAMKLCYILNTLPEFLYPELTRAWRREVQERKEKLQKVASDNARQAS
jgi:transcriptional regulator with XRE-family HTH domain